jgi:hypothetical protein
VSGWSGAGPQAAAEDGTADAGFFASTMQIKKQALTIVEDWALWLANSATNFHRPRECNSLLPSDEP